MSLRTVKSNAPFVGSVGGASRRFFICDNTEMVIATGGGTDYLPMLYPETYFPNQGTLFPFTISKGCIISASGSVSSSSVAHNNVALRFVFNDGAVDSAPITLGVYNNPTVNGFDWRFDTEIYPTTTYDPEKTIFAYRSNSKLVIRDAVGTITRFELITDSNSMVFTQGENWFPKIGFAVGSASVGYAIYRRMFRYEER